MFLNEKIIKINFKDSIIKGINTLYFEYNYDIIYYNNNHLNYIYKYIKDNLEYIFYGFFKDGYFIIIYDSYHEDLNINVESKYLILIKLNWILFKVNDELKLWILDEKKINNLNTKCLLLINRKKMFNNNINLDILLKISDCENKNINIQIIDKIKKEINIKKNIIKNILSFIL